MSKPLKAILACLLLLASVNFSHAQVSIGLVKPLPNQPVDSSFNVQVGASSPVYAITSVVATIQGRSTPLTYLSSSTYSGVLSLAGLPKDSVYTLTVVAKNANGDSGVVSASVIYDPAPVLTVIKPIWGDVARPTIDFKATCAPTAGHCQIVVRMIDGTTNIPVGTFTDSVNTSVDVSAYQGKTSMGFELTATDQYNVQSVQNGNFYVETSPYLTPLYTADKPINGFWGNNILVNNLQLTESPHIINYTTGVNTTVPFKGLIPYTGGEFISSTGMVFLAQHVDQTGAPIGQQTLYDWNSGTLDSLGWPSAGYLQAGGNYATWMGSSLVGGGLYIRDLSTKAIQLAAPVADNDYGLHSSGAVAYPHQGPTGDSLFLYKNGVSTPVKIQITHDSLVGAPLTDGKSVVYLNQSMTTFNRTKNIYLYDAKSGTNMLLAGLGNSSDHPEIISTDNFYRIANGYTAYLKPDVGFKYQAWVRDTAGNNTQASFFSLSSQLETMAPNGQLAFLNATTIRYGGRYVFDKTAGLTAISSQLGKSYYQDTSWYLTIGNTLFRVNLNITADKADSFAVNAKEDSLYTFTVNDFASHYHTSGSLMSVVISKLPAHGTLKLSGADVTINQSIPRASLKSLVYKPAAGFTGSDTVVWAGSNSFTPSPAAALLVINVDVVVPTVPPAPQISGLASFYCINYEWTVDLTITNIATAGRGATVSASLDGNPITVSGTGGMSINPRAMSMGTHALVVIFTNSAGADTTNISFRIVRTSTPVVKLTATPSTLTSSTTEVLLTATDVADGGVHPLYSFATDRLFTDHVLQNEGESNTIAIPVSSLTADPTIVYVSMKTSDTCINRDIGVDSVVLFLPHDTTTTPPEDSTGTGGKGTITVGPNPFKGDLIVRGLDPAKSYGISLVNINGRVVVNQAVRGQNQAILHTSSLGLTLYYMRVTDVQTGRIIGRRPVLKVN